jgi:potassium/hydrogen antiporter
MAALDTVSLTILFAALLVLAGILSSLVALRFGAPLLLVFLVIGMLAGESGPGGVKFDDVRSTYLVGSVALALILFDGGLRTRFATFRSVLAPALTLATIGVLLTAALTAPVARFIVGPRPTPPRFSFSSIPAACGCDRGSAPRSKSSPAPTTRSPSF